MNSLLAWFNSPEWMIVVKTLLHTLWQAGGFALLLWIALRRVATPSSRYRLTLGTLTAILGTTLLTWALLNQSAPAPATPDVASPITPTHDLTATPRASNLGEPSVIAYATPIAKPAEETRWSGWLALAWLLGSALMLTRAGIQVAGAERLRRSCKPLDDSRITQLLLEAQRALNLTRRIRVAVTDKLTSPAVVGVIVPTLILPLTLLSTLTPEQIRFILLHELAHIRRGDYFANLFQLFIEALLFFNPAVWWISHQVRREREACCDALAIELSGAPVDYAWTLLHVAETALNPPPAAASAFSDNPREPSSLTDRVQRLLVPGYRPALRLTWRAMLAAIVVGGTLLFLSAVGARSTVGAVLSSKQSASENTLRKAITNATDEFQILTNGLELKLLGQKLTADFIEVNKTTGKVVARGNVRLETTNGTSHGDEFRSNNATNLEPVILIVWDKAISPVPWTNPLPADWMIDASSETFELADGYTQMLLPLPPFRMRSDDASVSWLKDLPVAFRALFSKRRNISISNKLDQITFDRISFDHQPWTNVIKTVSDRARKLDPNKRGVNLIVNPNTAETAPTTNAQPASTPLLPPLVFISVAPELTNASLRQVLDAIVKGADKPITYQLEDYAVVFSLKGFEFESLETRLFHIPTDVVYEKILTNFTHTKLGQPIGELEGTNRLQAMRERFSEWIQHRGVNINPTRGKTIFYNETESEGMLFVRATKPELDTIEAAVRDVCIRPPQVNIKIRWLEIPKSLVTTAWLIASSNEFFGPLSNPDVSLSILTEAQTKDVLKRIERRDGFKLISEGQVTTLSERQAQISISEQTGVVANINPKALTKPGVVSTNKDSSDFLKMETISLGPVFDVIPTVSADEDTISLKMTITLREFLGYTKAEKEVTIYVDGKKMKTTLPLPIYRVRQITQNPVVTDGTTMILGNLPTKEIAKQPNGEMRTNDVTSTQTNLLFILVTPTIIDPAGNRAKPAPILYR